MKIEEVLSTGLWSYKKQNFILQSTGIDFFGTSSKIPLNRLLISSCTTKRHQILKENIISDLSFVQFFLTFKINWICLKKINQKIKPTEHISLLSFLLGTKKQIFVKLRTKGVQFELAECILLHGVMGLTLTFLL